MSEFVKKVTKKLSKLSNEQLTKIIEDMYAENTTLDSIIESLSVGLIIVDTQWCLMQKNKASERLLNFRKRQGESKNESHPLWELIGEPEVSEYIEHCANNSKCNTSEEFSFADEDKVRFVNISIVPFLKKIWNKNLDKFEKSIGGAIITVEDITQKKQQEILLHRMENLSSLTNVAASVAHEIKNPLGAISIHIQLMQKALKMAREKEVLPPEKFMEDYLKVVNEEIDRLNKIVVDFLFAVRPVQATMQLTNPDELLKNIIEFFRPEFDDRDIHVKLKLCDNPQRLLIDEKLFREVIVNLTQNAMFAILETRRVNKCARGELVIESFIRNEKYFLTVADNGCGMDEDTAARIFEPYYTTKSNGTGLGLTTVYKIIKEFSGDIAVQSKINKGTIFTICIPVPQKGIKLLAN